MPTPTEELYERLISNDGTDGLPTTPAYRIPLGYIQIALSNTVASVLAPPAGTTQVDITIEAQAARYRDDGTPPTATVGMPLAVGASRTVSLSNNAAIQLIGSAVGSIANISYYRT